MNKTLFKLSFPECIEIGWHVFSFDSAESVDSQWVILYKYDPCSLYMNNVGLGVWWSDKQSSRKYVFILTPNKVSLLKESLAQSIIFNTTILVKWIQLCLNFHFPNALRWVDMFSVLTALKVWTHNGWFYTCTTHVRCTWIMSVREAGGGTYNCRGNTFSY